MDKVFLYMDTRKGMFTLSPFKANFRISSTIVMYEMPSGVTVKELSEFAGSGVETDSGYEYKDTKNIKRVSK